MSCEINDLVRWMTDRGFEQNSKLSVYQFEDTGRGLITKEDILPGEEIISVPENLFLTSSIASLSFQDYFLYSNEEKKTLTETEILTMFLANERLAGKTSNWFTYLKTLPVMHTILTSIPIGRWKLFPREVKFETENEMNKIRKAFKNVRKLRLFLEEKMAFRKIDFRLFLWAWNCVNSRCVSLNAGLQSTLKQNNTDTMALIPFLDLLNHSPDAKVSASFEKSRKCFKIISLKEIKNNSQVFIHYGSHGNRKLILHYGFISLSNRNDVIPFNQSELINPLIENVCHSICLEKKMNFLKKHHFFESCNCSVDGLSWSLLVTMTFLIREICIMCNSIFPINYQSILKLIQDETTEDKFDLNILNPIILILTKKISNYNLLKVRKQNQSIILINSFLNREKQILSDILNSLKSLQN